MAVAGAKDLPPTKRDAAMRTCVAAWTAATMLAGASPVVSAEEPLGRPTALTVIIHVTDNANLSHTELAGAEAEATAAYRAAGLDIVWMSAPWSPGVGYRSGPRSIDVRLVIVPRDMAEKKCREENLSDRALGIAISGAREAQGRIAYVFYDRIERVSVSHGMPVVRGLGHIIAHEVGHLLMGAKSHSNKGLMQANWDPRDSRTRTFRRSEVQQIHRRHGGAN